MTGRHMFDHTNKVYGMITVIKFTGKRIKENPVWLCRCSCGKEKEIQSRYLKSTKSCGCTHGNQKPKGVAAFNSLLHYYKKGAEHRNHTWNLSKNQFKKITKMNCYYCGIEPSNISGHETWNGDYIYTGIDRIDNIKGYEIDNVVPCCKICNYMKRDHSKLEFLNHIEKILSHFDESSLKMV